MRMVVGSEGPQGSRSDRIAELEARNEELTRKLKMYQEALEDEQYENRKLQDDLRVAVGQGIKYRDALQQLIALREGKSVESSASAALSAPDASAERKQGNRSSPDKRTSGSRAAGSEVKRTDEVGSVTYYSSKASDMRVSSSGGAALEEELKKSCAAVVLGQVDDPVSPPAPRAGYEDSVNYSSMSSPSPYRPRAPQLWTPETDASKQPLAKARGATQEGSTQGFDENSWKRATEDLVGTAPNAAKEVSLVNLGLSTVTVPRVHQVLSKHAKSVQRLDLSYNYLRNSGAIALVGVGWPGPLMEVLQNLDLADNQIGDSGAAAVSEAASRLKSLSSLALGGNLITKQGAASIAAGLRSATLTSLHLDFNTIGDEGAISLTFAVNDRNRLPALASLHLNSNKIGRQGVEALVESATKKEDGQSGASGDRYSSAVQQLYLRGNVATVAPEVQLLIDQHPKLTVFL